MIDHATRLLIEEWQKHHAAKPDIPDDYAVNVAFLGIRMDEWERHDNALRVVVGGRLAESALRGDL